MLLSLFCGAGGLDLGFEQAGFDIGLAFDKNPDSVRSYNHNRMGAKRGHLADVAALSLARLDEEHKGEFRPLGVIGGPPCQSFSRANQFSAEDDPRHVLPLSFVRILKELNERNPIHFFVMENVIGLLDARHSGRLAQIETAFGNIGFPPVRQQLRATDFETPQIRDRVFWVGFNEQIYPDIKWNSPSATTLPNQVLSVQSAIGGLPEPVHFRRGLSPQVIPFHPNHWCMTPKSRRFAEQSLEPGNSRHRSFKTLAWDKPSITVAYGHREVHVHPGCHRRLSVYEAMLLQGFPENYELLGTLSSQIDQISEAVPPLMAKAVAHSILRLLVDVEQNQAA